MKRWHLPSLAPSTHKRIEHEPGTDAPRVPSTGRQNPRVLFSSPECRVIVVDLRRGDEMGDHRVHERAVVEVVAGRVAIDASGERVECDAGTLVTFEPGERHALRGLEDARVLLVLAPWPGAEHNAAGEESHGQYLPVNATVEPIGSEGTPGD